MGRVRRGATLGDDPLRQLATAVRSLNEFKGAAATSAGSVFGVLRGVRSLLRWWRSVPTLDLELRSGAAGSDIARELALGRWPTRRRALLAVAELPTHAPDYLVGRSRQAVRTNRSRALKQGLRAAEATDADMVEQCVERLALHGIDGFFLDAARWRLSGGLGRFWTVIDAEGVTHALASVSVDASVARINGVHVVPRGDQSAIRYLLASQIFLDLAAEHVRYVVTDRALRASPGVIYLQDRLGYRPMRVRLPTRR